MKLTAPFDVGAVVIGDDKSVITFKKHYHPDAITLVLEGNCCSTCFFEENSIVDAKALKGKKIIAIEQVESQTPNTTETGDEDVVLKYHAVKIITSREEVILDWRNESNGYYDGECYISFAKRENWEETQ